MRYARVYCIYFALNIRQPKVKLSGLYKSALFGCAFLFHIEKNLAKLHASLAVILNFNNDIRIA